MRFCRPTGVQENRGPGDGVTANSHEVVGQLLTKAAQVAGTRGANLSIGQRPGPTGRTTYESARVLRSNAEARRALAGREVDVVGGTVWLWGRGEFADAIDVLIVDEAGQMALANTLAAASAAKSLVLLGDPQQLDQPLRGSHPAGAKNSALAHVLGGSATMPDQLGLFLDGTWRLHPDICDFTSGTFYDGRLVARPGRDLQAIRGAGPLAGAGVRFIPVVHEGNTHSSAEEAESIAGLIGELLGSGARWVDDSGVERPLALEDILVITPYNAQVREIRERLPSARVGTVDKFQGQEAPLSIYSLAASSAEDAPRGLEFVLSLNRLNVATSRARCVSAVVGNPRLLTAHCKTPSQMRLANSLARFVELANQD